MKNKNILIIVLLLTITFFVGINKVFAATCSEEQYQCITCTYKMDKDSGADYDGTNYRVTLKSDKNGTVKKESSSLTNDSYGLNDSKVTANAFIKNNKLECIPLYVKPDNRIGTTSITVTTESDGNVPTTMLEPNDNGKPFKASSASATLTCSNITILTSNDSALSEEDMRGVNTANEKATITVSGNSFSITSIDDRYKLASNPTSEFRLSDFSNGCPEDMYIHCNAAEGAYDSCHLTRYSSTSDNYIYSGTSTRVNSSAPSTDSEEETENPFGSGYETRCSDVYYATLAWRIITVSATFLLIIFTSFDYIKVVVAGNEEEMKKAKKNIPKRIIAFLLFLFVPLIVRLIVTTFGRNGAQNISMFECIVRGDFGENDTPYTHPNNGEETWESIGNNLRELQERIQEQAANEINRVQENVQDFFDSNDNNSSSSSESNSNQNSGNGQSSSNRENNDSTVNQSDNNQNNTNTRISDDFLDGRR